MLSRLWSRLFKMEVAVVASKDGTMCEVSPCASQELAPQTPHTAVHSSKRRATCHLLELPCELLEYIVTLDTCASDMCALAQTCTKLCQLQYTKAGDEHWQKLFCTRFGPAGALQSTAAKLAGGWKRLYAARHQVEKEAAPWQKPSSFEVQAAVQRLACGPGGQLPPQAEELCVVFLVDGSGSVTEDDFSCMTSFMQTAVNSIAVMGLPAKVCVLQFSNDVRVELGPSPIDTDAFDSLVQSLHRMNGGTNISLAVQKAGQLLKPLGGTTRRVLVLLTDGRVDSHQAREAHDMASRLADEQPLVDLHAFGVGRGVDKTELLHIISACDPEGAEERYLGLCVLDEAPW